MYLFLNVTFTHMWKMYQPARHCHLCLHIYVEYVYNVNQQGCEEGQTLPVSHRQFTLTRHLTVGLFVI